MITYETITHLRSLGHRAARRNASEAVIERYHEALESQAEDLINAAEAALSEPKKQVVSAAKARRVLVRYRAPTLPNGRGFMVAWLADSKGQNVHGNSVLGAGYSDTSAIEDLDAQARRHLPAGEYAAAVGLIRAALERAA